jgi:hypothetical protein
MRLGVFSLLCVCALVGSTLAANYGSYGKKSRTVAAPVVEPVFYEAPAPDPAPYEAPAPAPAPYEAPAPAPAPYEAPAPVVDAPAPDPVFYEAPVVYEAPVEAPAPEILPYEAPVADAVVADAAAPVYDAAASDAATAAATAAFGSLFEPKADAGPAAAGPAAAVDENETKGKEWIDFLIKKALFARQLYPKIRREYRTLAPHERAEFHKAINKLKADTVSNSVYMTTCI